MRPRSARSALPFPHSASVVPLATGSLALVAGLTAGRWAAWQIDLNDVWGLVYLAQHASVTHIQSLYSGFFPVAYPLALRAAGVGDFSVAAGIANVLTLALLSGLTAAAAHRLAGSSAAWLAGLGVLLQPDLFRYGTSAGPDIAAAFAGTIGAAMLLFAATAEDSGRRNGTWLVAGLFLGLGALFRYHGLALAASCLVVSLASAPARVRSTGLLLAGCLIAYLPQLVVNLASGHGLFDTAQAFNVAKTVQPVNWFELRDGLVPSSIAAVVRDNPSGFARAYVQSALRALPIWLISITAAAVVDGVRARAWAIRSAVMVVVYTLIVAAGGSSRAPLLVMPLVIVGGASALSAGWARFSGAARSRFETIAGRALLCFLAGTFCLSALVSNLSLVRTRRARSQEYHALERYLRDVGGVRTARQVFASDFDLYFQELPDHRPLVNGGWFRLDLPAFDELHPQLCVRTVACLVSDARRLGVTHVVLTSEAAMLSSALESLRLSSVPESEGLVRSGRVGRFEVFSRAIPDCISMRK